MKTKQFFYIQLAADFFQSENMEALSDIAKQNGDSSADYFIVYLKLMLASLNGEGVIAADPGKVLTPALLKKKLRFNIYGDYGRDLAVLDRAVEAMEKESLIARNDSALVVMDIATFISSKKQRSQDRLLQRRKANAIINDIIKDKDLDGSKLTQLSALTDVDTPDYILDGLSFNKFISDKEKNSFLNTILETMEEYDRSEFFQAANIFINRLKWTDISKIENKANYFKSSIDNIIFKELRTADFAIDQILNELTELNIIKNAHMLRDYKSELLQLTKKLGVTPKYLVELFNTNRLALFNTNKLNDSETLAAALTILFKNDKKKLQESAKDTNADTFDKLAKGLATENSVATPDINELEKLKKIAEYDWVNRS